MGVETKTFRKKLLAASISSCVLATANIAFAQSDEPAVIEEVQVFGIRASVQASMDIKRDSSGVVDAITAEDIGKFPDANLAESLQRITGVSIERRNGEGSQVTVRGFGPDYNMVTLNGRAMPSASLGQNIGGGANTASRAFDMDNIAAEGVSGVEVYKTAKANLSGGGVGATINLKTARPFDFDGLKASVGAKAVTDTTNRVGDDITPELSGLLSWSNEKFGVLGNFSFQERHSGQTGAYVNGWPNGVWDGSYPITVSPAQAGVTLEGPATQIENPPAIGEVYGNPNALRYYHADHERTRTNGQLVFQFAPTESITSTLDYTFAQQEIYQNRAELSLWFQDFPRTNLAFDNAASPMPVLFWEESRNSLAAGAAATPARDVGLALQQQNQINELESIGFNVEWQATEELSFVFDVHNSESESSPDAPFGNWANVGLGANISLNQGADWTTELPVLMMDFDDSTRAGQNGNGVLDIGDIGSTVMDLRRESARAEITQVRIDGKFEFSNASKIDFGVESRKLESLGRQAQKQQLLNGGWGVATPGDVPAAMLSSLDYASLFDGYALSSPNQAWFNGVSGSQAAPLTVGVIGDAAVVGAHLANAAGLTFDVTNLNEVADSVNRLVEEDVLAAYFQFGFDSELGDMPLSVLAGLRYEGTEVTSTSNIAIPVLNWNSNDDFLVAPPSGAVPENFAAKASYNHLLPNLDIKLNVTDSIVARFSYGKTIARATFDQLSTAYNISGGPSLPTILPESVRGNAVGGNPGVLPLESDNIDLSVEWYFDDLSYVSVGYFEKRVNNFTGIEPTPLALYGIKDPSNGPRAQQARADLVAAGRPVNATTLFTQMAANAAGAAYESRTVEEWELAYDFVGNADDPDAIFSALVPQNINDARVEGFEIAGQYFFGETGFGVMANYTFVSANTAFDVTLDPALSQFALVGVSDTANMSLVYEDYGFSGRLSYNWRDEFLNNSARGGANEPEFTEAYSQLDFTVSYEVMDDLFVSIEGLNITDEDQRKHGRSERQLTEMSVLGARYALGVRYSF